MNILFKMVFTIISFYSVHSHSCDLINIMTNKIGDDVNVTKDGVLFSGGSPNDPAVSILEIDYNNQHAMALTQGVNDIKDFSTYSHSICALSGGKCKELDIDGNIVLQIEGDGVRSILVPIFVGGLLVAQVQHTQPIELNKNECSKPNRPHVKNSIEIFMRTGQKERVLDYLKSIKKI